MNTEILSTWGTDITVVNNARVSFDKESDFIWSCAECGLTEGHSDCDDGHTRCYFKPRLSKSDEGIIQFLARGCRSGEWETIINQLDNYDFRHEEISRILNNVRKMPDHWAPFANGVGARFRLTLPIPIMRQVFKHKVGSVESEVSRRYVSDEPEVIYPEWRGAPEGDIKQGSGGLLNEGAMAQAKFIYNLSVEMGLSTYNSLVNDLKVCPEQARFVLPQGAMTTAIVSNSLYGWANFYNQRHDRAHAQHEVADVADLIGEALGPVFPSSWKALTA